MIEQFKRISTIAMMAGILALGAASPARANLEIQLSKTGLPLSYSTVAFTASGGFLTYTNANWSGTHFSISSLSTDSNSHGDPTLANLDGSVTSIQNNGPAATLYIKLGDTGWIKPFVPGGYLVYDSSIDGSVKIAGSGAGTNSLVFQSYVDPANGQNSTVGITQGPQTPSIVALGPFNSDLSENVYSLNTTFSMTQFFAIHLRHGAKIGFVTGTSLTLLPEPSSLAIAGLGALGLVGFGLRRRKGA